jgi:hypothetical protein
LPGGLRVGMLFDGSQAIGRQVQRVREYSGS